MGDLAIAVAIVAAVQKIYSTYQQVIGFLQGSGPSEDDEILQLVQDLTQQLGQIAQAISQLQQLAVENLEETEQAAVNENIQAVQEQASNAQAAAENYAEWVMGGKPNIGTQAVQNQPAWQLSLTAATTMRNTTEYFVRPVPNTTNNTVTNEFDYRLALAQYVYVLSVRLTVILGMEPGWASDDTILQELSDHVERLQQLAASMDDAIAFESTTWLPPQEAPNTFGVDATCTDTIGGYSTDPWRSPLQQGTTADAAAYVRWLKGYLGTQVRNAIGVTTLEQFTSLVAWYASGAKPTGTWTPWSPIAADVAPGGPAVAGANNLWPLAAVSSEPEGVTVAWGAPGAVSTIAFTPGVGWGPQSTIPGSKTAGSPFSRAWGPGIVATSCATGNVCVFWTANDGSIQGSYYDTRATEPAWAQAFPVLAPAAGVAPFVLGAVSSNPGSVTVFYAQDDHSVTATSLTLSLESSGGNTVVSVSPLSTPVVTGAVLGGGGPSTFTALSSGPGSISLIYSTNQGLESTFYDERATDPTWAKPSVIAPASSASSGLAAISPSPYAITVYWFQGASPSTVSISSFTLVAEDDNPTHGLIHRVVTQTTPTPATAVPWTTSYAQPGPGLAAVATAPVVAGAVPAGATTLFWMTEAQMIESAWQSPATGWSDTSPVGAALGTSIGPIVAVPSGPGDISLFLIIPQSNTQGDPGAFAIETAQWRVGKLPEIPAPPRIPLREPLKTNPTDVAATSRRP